MTRIRIVKIEEGARRSPDYVLKSRKVFHGDDVGKVLKVNPSKKGGIQITSLERPSICPMCLTDGKVVNFTGQGGHFRCTVCQHIWG